MKVLQICNGYYMSRLYDKLFEGLNYHSINSEVMVSMRKNNPIKSDKENVYTLKAFNYVDRFFFKNKCRKILGEIEKKYHNVIVQSNLIHAHTLFSDGYIAYSLYKKYNIPYMVAVRNTDLNVFFKYRKNLKHIGIEIMKNASAIIYLSKAYLERTNKKYIPIKYRDTFLKKSFVIPNGIESIWFENESCEKKNRTSDVINIVYTGEISTNKNIKKTIEAIEILRNRGLSVNYTVIGQMLEKKYETLMGKKWVNYYPFLSAEELIEMYKTQDVFVMPSKTETFGLVYAEAMSQGLPVIYTSGEGFDKQFPEGDVGFSVDCNNEINIANKIEQIIKDYDNLSMRAKANSGIFKWEKISEQYKDIYKKIVIDGDNNENTIHNRFMDRT